MCILVILYKKPIFQEDSLKEKRNLKKQQQKKVWRERTEFKG